MFSPFLIEVTKEFLENFLPDELLALFDLDTLTEDPTEYTTPELAAVLSDKVFRCNLRREFSKSKKKLLAVIAILLEHKSYAPPYPHFQLNEYRQRIWSNRVGNKKKPFAVLPVILYHGTTKWKKKDLAAYFGNLPDAMKPLYRRVRLCIDRPVKIYR
ncbi:MAG TPA: hypothetical protein ENJ95_07980 [Bacteroidetes bacterium]|nr:hypothetical protein [Bacteroidota bacterium]